MRKTEILRQALLDVIDVQKETVKAVVDLQQALDACTRDLGEPRRKAS